MQLKCQIKLLQHFYKIPNLLPVQVKLQGHINQGIQTEAGDLSQINSLDVEELTHLHIHAKIAVDWDICYPTASLQAALTTGQLHRIFHLQPSSTHPTCLETR